MHCWRLEAISPSEGPSDHPELPLEWSRPGCGILLTCRLSCFLIRQMTPLLVWLRGNFLVPVSALNDSTSHLAQRAFSGSYLSSGLHISLPSVPVCSLFPNKLVSLFLGGAHPKIFTSSALTSQAAFMCIPAHSGIHSFALFFSHCCPSEARRSNVFSNLL